MNRLQTVVRILTIQRKIKTYREAIYVKLLSFSFVKAEMRSRETRREKNCRLKGTCIMNLTLNYRIVQWLCHLTACFELALYVSVSFCDEKRSERKFQKSINFSLQAFVQANFNESRSFSSFNPQEPSLYKY